MCALSYVSFTSKLLPVHYRLLPSVSSRVDDRLVDVIGYSFKQFPSLSIMGAGHRGILRSSDSCPLGERRLIEDTLHLLWVSPISAMNTREGRHSVKVPDGTHVVWTSRVMAELLKVRARGQRLTRGQTQEYTSVV